MVAPTLAHVAIATLGSGGPGGSSGSRAGRSGASPSVGSPTSFEEVLRHTGRAFADLHDHVFQVKQSSALCCGTMASGSAKAYEDLDEAERALAFATHARSHDLRPSEQAEEKTEESMRLLKPLADMDYNEELKEEGPWDMEQQEALQSAVTRDNGFEDLPDDPKGSSGLALLPAAFLVPSLLNMKTNIQKKTDALASKPPSARFFL
mmetsp:Transcript_1813/g.4109  ORF Transcript_1813/g.4109 Transcript_1813/m.4109 type:complete len:207 (-) Transcript_1813:152-772(-)